MYACSVCIQNSHFRQQCVLIIIWTGNVETVHLRWLLYEVLSMDHFCNVKQGMGSCTLCWIHYSHNHGLSKRSFSFWRALPSWHHRHRFLQLVSFYRNHGVSCWWLFRNFNFISSSKGSTSHSQRNCLIPQLSCCRLLESCSSKYKRSATFIVRMLELLVQRTHWLPPLDDVSWKHLQSSFEINVDKLLRCMKQLVSSSSCHCKLFPSSHQDLLNNKSLVRMLLSILLEKIESCSCDRDHVRFSALLLAIVDASIRIFLNSCLRPILISDL